MTALQLPREPNSEIVVAKQKTPGRVSLGEHRVFHAILVIVENLDEIEDRLKAHYSSYKRNKKDN